MQAAIDRYLQTIVEGRPANRVPTVAAGPAPAAASNVMSNSDLLADMMSETPHVIYMATTTTASSSSPKLVDDFAALDDIFTKPTQRSGGEASSAPLLATDVLLLADDNAAASAVGLEPLLSPTTTTTTTTLPTDAAKPVATKRPADVQPSSKPVSEMDMFGLDSVITGLKMNLAVQTAEKSTPSVVAVTSPVDTVAEPLNEPSDDDDEILQLPDAPHEPSEPLPSMALADLHVDLANITPANLPPRIVLDDPLGLKVVLNFAADRPRADVACCVLTVTNQARQPIRALSVIASASKPCKVRQLPASGDRLDACKPFRPPADDVTQVLLVANPGGEPYALMCIVGYRLGDDPDELKEVVHVEGLPAWVD